MQKEHIKIDGYRGKWYVIDEYKVGTKTYYLLEHEFYGDETSNLTIDDDYNVIADDTYDDIKTVLYDCGIID